MAQLVKRPTLDFSSGHDLTVGEVEPAWDSVSVSASPLLTLSLSQSLSLSLSLNK